MTHTYAILDVSQDAYDEIKKLLDIAGYQHAFDRNVIDMHGIALRAIPKKKEHVWEFYMNGSFCKICNAQLGDGIECK